MSLSSNLLGKIIINASGAFNTSGTKMYGAKKKIQAWSGIRTHDLCDTGAVLSQLSYPSHMRAVVYGLAQYVDVILGPSIINKVN